MLNPELTLWLDKAGLKVSPEQATNLAQFEEALYALNATRNLTHVPREEFWSRHVIDSLLFDDLIPKGASVLDIGTGPGFPAWPLAWARPDLKVTALDSSGKMLGFLRGQPLPNLAIVLERAEDWGVREAFDVVTGRALAQLAIQLELSAAPCKVGGAVIPMRTPSDEPLFESLDVAALGLRLESVERRKLESLDVERLFPVYRKVRATPSKYPRKWAEIRKEALGT
jgi:16S rRNA (guanine527-N7)-methyltransferase